MNAPVPRDTEIRVHSCIAANGVFGKGERDFSHVNRLVQFAGAVDDLAHTYLRVWERDVVLPQTRYLVKFVKRVPLAENREALG